MAPQDILRQLKRTPFKPVYRAPNHVTRLEPFVEDQPPHEEDSNGYR